MPPILETQRLILRPPCWSDLEDAHRIGSNPRVMRYITPGEVQTMDDTREELSKRIRTTDKPLGYWVIESRHDQSFIGWMALRHQVDSLDIEIGYRLDEAHWGKGYATEAARRVLWYAFSELGLERVVAVAMKENWPSRKVLDKLGMQFVQTRFVYGLNCAFYAIGQAEYLKMAILPQP